ncbi:MAG: ribonucleoside triphosphate reductase, partial [Campylobacteraceae bacterium]|nr:ribonucleoside triphosphate reductase [Campylobacteraceae bacterium]
MLSTILKRNGTTQEFFPYKIEDAIHKAFKSENVTYDHSVFQNLMARLQNKRVAAVEDIQDMIEQELYRARYFDVMRSFMIYR